MSNDAIELSIRGHTVPSFKNSKLLTRGRLITKPEYQKIMEAMIRSFESQLRSWCRTNGIETGTGRSALSVIASFMPLDDSRKWIAEHSVKWRPVSKGNEGCVVSIERI